MIEHNSIKKWLIISTYMISLYLALSNIKIVAGALSYIMGIISPLVIGICIAFILNIILRFIENYLLQPLTKKVEWIDRRKRLISVMLTYIFAISVIIMMILFIVPQVLESLKSLVEMMPGYGKELQIYANGLYEKLGLSQEIWDQLLANLNNVTSSLTKLTANTVNIVINFTIGLTSGVVELFIGIIFSVYILLSKEKLIEIVAKMNQAYMGQKVAKTLVHIMSEVNDTFSKFIGGQMLESLILGLLCFIGMVILKIPYAPLVSTLVAITSVIPVLGAYIGIVPSAFIIFMESPVKALIFIIFITILQQVENNMIYPKVVGKAIGLDGFWVLLAIVMAGKLFGIFGMLIGVPTMAVIYSLVRRATNKRIANMAIRE